MKTFLSIVIIWIVGTWLLASIAGSLKNNNKK